MSPRTAILVLASVASFSAACVVSNAVHIRRANTAARAESMARLAVLTTQRDAALASLKSSAPDSAATISRANTSPRPGAQPVASASLPTGRAYRAWRRAQEDDPALQVFKQEADRALRHLKYATFVRSMSLTADQAETLDRIVQEHDARRLDLSRSISVQQLDINDPAAVALRAEAIQARAADLRTLLGEAGFAQFTTYERTVDLRQAVASYSVAATMIGEPLTASQTEEMLQILAASNPPYRAGGSAAAGAVEWENAMPRMQALLSASQFAHLSQIEPDVLGGSTSRFNLRFLMMAQEARDRSLPDAP